MRHRRRALIPIASIALIAVTLLAVLIFVRGPEATSPSGPRYAWYLALGDSLTAGVGAARPAEEGYVGQVNGELRARGGTPDTANLAIPGATTRSMISGGQLQQAVDYARAHRDQPGLITISIGGNDGARLYAPCAFGSIDLCRRLALEAITASDAALATIFEALAEAAGEETRIVVLTYYNPLRHPGCILHAHEPLAASVLDGGAPLDLPRSLNALIRDRAEGVGASIADLSMLDESGLTPDCLHPNTAGHALIARKVLDVLPG